MIDRGYRKLINLKCFFLLFKKEFEFNPFSNLILSVSSSGTNNLTDQRLGSFGKFPNEPK